MGPVSALVDTFTHALLALSAYPAVVSVLAKSQSLEAEQWHAVNWPNYQQRFPPAGMVPQAYPSWKWEGGDKRQFVPMRKDLVTAELQGRSQLAVVKSDALGRIVYELSMLRFPVWRGVLMQEAIFIIKKTQAEQYKQAGYPDTADIFNYPYVLQYAEVSDLHPRQAADEILFKAKLDDDVLLRTEFLRLKYFKLICDATKMDEFEPIMRDFRHDAYGQRHDRDYIFQV